MAQRGWWIRGAVVGSALLLAPVGAWADKLTDLEQAFDAQQKSLQQLQQEMQRLRQERSAQQEDVTRRVMEVEKKAAEAAASAWQVGFDPWPGKGFYVKSTDGQHRLSIGGYVQTLAQVEASRNEEDVDSADKSAAINRHRASTLKLHRVRLHFDVQLFKDFGLHINPEFVGPTDTKGSGPSSTTRIEAAFGHYTYAPWLRVKVGQFRDQYALENGSVPQDLYFAAQRSFITRALSPDLQMGLMLFGGTKLADMLPISYSVGVYNGCGRVDQCTTDNDGDKEYTGRITIAPPMPIGNLTVGANADFRTFNNKKGGARDLATNPVAGTNYHRFNPTSVLGDLFGGDGNGTSMNGFRINGDRTTTGADFVYDLYPIILTGEFHYASQERDGLGTGSNVNLDDLRMMGGYGTVGYWVFGNKLKGLLVNGRYEHLRVDDTKGNFTAAAGTNEQTLRVRVGTMGATWYVNPNIFVRANYVLTDVNPGKNFFGVSNNTQGELTHQGIAEAVFKF
ncbi:MAG: hypothetical protein F9K13_09285 [Candidatus Methylomirabilis oxygeniifera]|uniref:Phosphate-selective porin O and P n=1 Tax=Methylomirabilis oxygeniifera TaxID=671143 RepID=D5MJC9_METO1|nr:MAG: hypothetical protein F9K13_09285 [Candidatus Methylomirabilis oxyfera]CBE69511.1 exported protein of unknown function [Candidatus Methylomirabilis oxyfera]